MVGLCWLCVSLWCVDPKFQTRFSPTFLLPPSTSSSMQTEFRFLSRSMSFAHCLSINPYAAVLSGKSPAEATMSKKPPPAQHDNNLPVSPVFNHGSPSTTKKRRSTFLNQVHRMLRDAEEEGNTHIVCWKPSGEAFEIVDTQLFIQHVMPRYFNQSKLTSFTRQLYIYQFQKVTEGPDKGAFSNPDFQRDRPELSERIKRITAQSTTKSLRSKKEKASSTTMSKKKKSSITTKVDRRTKAFRKSLGRAKRTASPLDPHSPLLTGLVASGSMSNKLPTPKRRRKNIEEEPSNDDFKDDLERKALRFPNILEHANVLDPYPASNIESLFPYQAAPKGGSALATSNHHLHKSSRPHFPSTSLSHHSSAGNSLLMQLNNEQYIQAERYHSRNFLARTGLEPQGYASGVARPGDTSLLKGEEDNQKKPSPASSLEEIDVKSIGNRMNDIDAEELSRFMNDDDPFGDGHDAGI